MSKRATLYYIVPQKANPKVLKHRILPYCVGKPDVELVSKGTPKTFVFTSTPGLLTQLVKIPCFVTFGSASWGTLQDKVAVTGIFCPIHI